MEPDGLLPCSQASVTGPSPESDESNPHSHVRVLIDFNIILPSASRCIENSVENFVRHSPRENRDDKSGEPDFRNEK